MRLMATGERWRLYHAFILETFAEQHLSWEENKNRTHIVHSPWNDDVYVLLCLGEKQIASDLFAK